MSTKNLFNINHHTEQIEKNNLTLVPYREINNYLNCDVASILNCAQKGFCDICKIHNLISVKKFIGIRVFIPTKQSEKEELDSLKNFVIYNATSYYLLYDKEENKSNNRTYYKVGMLTSNDLEIIKKCIKYHTMKVFL